MEKESTSFWADIKKYEDMLAKDPRSYCFAPLAELYRKLDLLDDAINVAQKGCEVHPDYVGGYMALGRAYYEKGMKAECRVALERVVTSTPDNLLAQKLLSQIYIESGASMAAEKSLRAVLAMNPDDPESQVLLKSLGRGDAKASNPTVQTSAVAKDSVLSDSGDLYTEVVSDDDLLLEDLEIIEDLTEEVETVSDEYPDDEMRGKESGYGSVFDEEGRKDPLQTATLAELYVSQGLLKPALEVYDGLQKSDPGNSEYVKRYAELSKAVATEGHITEIHHGDNATSPDTTVKIVTEISQTATVESTVQPDDTGKAVAATLEKWLENIRRRR